MKVLMYGWEFPPRISGGLGVACYHIVNELALKHVDIAMVLPETVEHTLSDRVTIIGCENSTATTDTKFLQQLLNISFTKIGGVTGLHPYMRSEEYHSETGNTLIDQAKILPDATPVMQHINALNQAINSSAATPIHITSEYNNDLFFMVLQYAVAAGAFAATTQHDVIHAHDWLTILAGIEAKKYSHKPLIFHVHALEPDRSGINVDERIFAIEKYGMQQADHIIAVSGYTKKIIIDKYGIPEDKITVVHNGTTFPITNLTELHKHKHHKMVLFLGRLAHQKGPYQFVEIAHKILQKRHDVHFVIAGAGSMLPEMVRRVAALRLGRYIHFTGFLDNKRVEKIYGLADVYVMPSVSEPFGISALEALSYNVPVVISKQSGVSEVLHHVFKVDFWDIQEMANKIVALLDYRALRKTSLSHTAAEIKHLTWARAAEHITNLYSKLIYNKKNREPLPKTQ